MVSQTLLIFACKHLNFIFNLISFSTIGICRSLGMCYNAFTIFQNTLLYVCNSLILYIVCAGTFINLVLTLLEHIRKEELLDKQEIFETYILWNFNLTHILINSNIQQRNLGYFC